MYTLASNITDTVRNCLSTVAIVNAQAYERQIVLVVHVLCAGLAIAKHLTHTNPIGSHALMRF